MSESTLLIGLLVVVLCLYLSLGKVWRVFAGQAKAKPVEVSGGEAVGGEVADTDTKSRAAVKARTPGVVRVLRVGLLFVAAVIGVYLYFPVPAWLGTELSGTYAELRPVLRVLDKGGATADLVAKRKQAEGLVVKLKGLTGKANFSSVLRGGPDVTQQADGLTVTLDRVMGTIPLEGALLETDNDLMMLQVRQLQKMLGGTEAKGAVQGVR